MRKLLKHFITDYVKITLYGDMELTEDGFVCRYAGKALKVQLLHTVWITYYYFRQ